MRVLEFLIMALLSTFLLIFVITGGAFVFYMVFGIPHIWGVLITIAVLIILAFLIVFIDGCY